MKVIGAGLARTATSTQMLALEQLGLGPVYHMRNLLADLDGELPKWESTAAGVVDWEAIFDDCESCVDWPAARYYEELADYYPDAKVLLSVRSPSSWVKSMRETVWGMYFGDSVMRHVCHARTVVDPAWARFVELMRQMTWDERTGALAGETFDDKSFATIMERWNAEVKATIPADRLLVWEPADGWAPLCEFLEVGIPHFRLPHANDAAAFTEGILGGGLAVLNAWWEQRERPSGGLHGAPVS